MNEQQKEMKKGWKRFWLCFDICLFGLCILLFFIQWDPIGVVDYLTGYFGKTWAFLLEFGLFCILIYLILLIVCVIRIIKWKDLAINTWKVLLMRTTLFLLMVLCFPMLAKSFPVHSPKPLTYIMGFQKWTGARLDIEEVREWMKGLDEEAYIEQRIISIGTKPSEDRNDILQTPECLLGIYPLIGHGSVYKDRQDQDQKCLKMYEGSGHGHWGVVVYLSNGRVSLPDPEKEGRMWMRLDDSAYVYWD